MRRFFWMICATLFCVQTSHAEDVTPGQAYLMIKHARPTVTEADGWASDLLEVMQVQNIPQSRENVCAAIAVID